MVVGLPKALPQEVQAALPADGQTTLQATPPPPHMSRAEKVAMLRASLTSAVLPKVAALLYHHPGALPAPQHRGGGGPLQPFCEGMMLYLNS